MILVFTNIKVYADIRGGCIGEVASSTVSPNYEHEFWVPGVLRIYTRHTSLRAASYRATGDVQNQHPINAPPVCHHAAPLL